MAVLFERLAVLRFVAVELGALEQHRPNAARLRAVRILVGFDLGVMLTMDGDPLLRHHPGRQPEPESEEMRDGRMQLQRAMRLTTVQIDGHRRNGDVREYERYNDIAPPGEGHKPVRRDGENIVSH